LAQTDDLNEIICSWINCGWHVFVSSGQAAVVWIVMAAFYSVGPYVVFFRSAECVCVCVLK